MHTMKRVLKIGNDMKAGLSDPAFKCHLAICQIPRKFISLQRAIVPALVGRYP